MEMLGQVEPTKPEVCPIPFNSEPREDLIDLSSSFCDMTAGGCGHALTVHTAGTILHGMCRMMGCGCNGAKLTEKAKKRVAREVMA